jgi:hypothetical protein
MNAKKKTMVFEDELSPGERLLWSGRPQQGVIFRANDIFVIPFSLFWAGFACVWTLAATVGGGCFGLFGLPFVAVGLYITVGRFYLDSLQRSRTIYALTNERLIILSGINHQHVKSISLRTLTDMTLDLKDSGRGTITFGPELPRASMYRGMQWPGMGNYTAPAFEGIDDARTVYNRIRQAQNNALA